MFIWVSIFLLRSWKNKNIMFKIRRSKVTAYAALRKLMHAWYFIYWQMSKDNTGCSVNKMLKMYTGYSKRAFDGLVTCNETCIYFYEPKGMRKSLGHKNAWRPIIVKRSS